MNLTRNAMPTGRNSSRSGLIQASHIWDEENYPWGDNTLPWQDNDTSPKFDLNGTHLAKNSTPSSSNLTRN